MTDLIAWCEDWARSRGYWVQDSAHRRKGWCVRAIDAAHLPPGFQVCRGGDDGFDGWTTLTPLQFWLWAHAVDSGRTDSQRCSTCEGERAVIEHVAESPDDPKQLDPYPWAKYQGWLARPNKGLGGAVVVREPFPCPICSAAGVLTVVLALRFCEAVPRLREQVCKSKGSAKLLALELQRLRHCVGVPIVMRTASKCMIVRYTEPGCSDARRDLLTHADALQAEGDPLGTALALWLHRVPCDSCKGGCRGGACDMGVGCDTYGICYADANNAPERCGSLCKACHGDGTALGAYVAARLKAETKQAEANRLAQWRADCDALESETMEDLAADFLDAMADTLPPHA